MGYGYGWEPDDPPEDPISVDDCRPGYTCEGETCPDGTPATKEVRLETGDPEVGVITRCVCDDHVEAAIAELRELED